ncbi:hypothetical protein C7402_1662 [Paraburkholderia unamae]|uniref:Uncharacterized protein n=1 Tax=Paraburkholderia unamae TaxID=219649 RepID=A0ABX5KB37_9BURK|nr:hypothetical protein C7402_1662 [Paraburkholderia unamae]
MNAIQFFLILIALILVFFFTGRLIWRAWTKKSLKWKDFYQWVRDIIDSIFGIG